jgi:WD40 repeat protein
LLISQDSRFLLASGDNGLDLWDLHDADHAPWKVSMQSCGWVGLHENDWLSLIELRSEKLEIWDITSRRLLCEDFQPNLWSRSRRSVFSYSLQQEYHFSAFQGLTIFQLERSGNRLVSTQVAHHPELTQHGIPLLSPRSNELYLHHQVLSLGDGQVRAQLFDCQGDDFHPKDFRPDGSWLYQAIAARVYGWEIVERSHRKIIVEQSQGKHFRAVACHPEGQRLGVVTTDNTISLYDIDSGSLMRTYSWDIGNLTCLKFTPDGTRCAIAGKRGKVLVFDLD